LLALEHRSIPWEPTVKRKTLRFGKGFRVALANRRTQAAEMVIEPGGAEGARRTGIAAPTNGCL
jgi:hypothetical protein